MYALARIGNPAACVLFSAPRPANALKSPESMPRSRGNVSNAIEFEVSEGGSQLVANGNGDERGPSPQSDGVCGDAVG